LPVRNPGGVYIKIDIDKKKKKESSKERKRRKQWYSKLWR
jgi:hypothetical protein